MSRALRDHVVCRSNVFIEFGESSVSMIGVDVSTVLGSRKLRLLSYGLLLVSVVVECVTRCCGWWWWWLLLVAVGNGVRERSGKVSTNGVEPKGVGVLLRGLSKMHGAIDCKWERERTGDFLPVNFDGGYRVSISSFSYTRERKWKFESFIQGAFRILKSRQRMW